MYVREKKVRRGERTYSYWQVVAGHRVGGKVKQRVVHHIGPAEDREHADTLARAKGVLCGVEDCNQAAAEEPEEGGQTPTCTMKLPGGRTREYHYLFCPAHVDAWKQGERLRGVPFVPQPHEAA